MVPEEEVHRGKVQLVSSGAEELRAQGHEVGALDRPQDLRIFGAAP